MKIDKEFVKGFLYAIFHAIPKDIYLNDDDDDDNEFYLRGISGSEIPWSFEQNQSFIYKNHHYKIDCGATKLVFIFDDFDEVIKLPITGEFYSFYGKIKYDNYDYDYLALEKVMYNNMPVFLKPILLENKFLTLFGEIPIYTQQKIKATFLESPSKTSLSKEIKNRISKRKNYNSLPNDSFLMDIINFYEDGEDIIECLTFSDLNKDNYGYLFNNQPVIFDYGGYDH